MKADTLLKAQTGIRAARYLAVNALQDAKAMLKNDPVALEFIEKAAVPSLGTDGFPEVISTVAAQNLAQAVIADSVLPLLQNGGANVRGFGDLAVGISASGASFVAQGKATQVIAGSTLPASERLTPYKISVITVLTDELTRSVSAETNAQIAQTLADTAGPVIDATLLDANAADDARPAGLLENAVAASANTVAAVMQKHAEKNKIAGTVLVLPVSAAFSDGFNEMAAGLFRLGVTLHVSPANVEKIIAINPRKIVMTAPATDLDNSTSGTIEMVDSSAQDSLAGTGTQLVSMFQTNSTAIRSRTWLDIRRLTDDAVTIGA